MLNELMDYVYDVLILLKHLTRDRIFGYILADSNKLCILQCSD